MSFRTAGLAGIAGGVLIAVVAVVWELLGFNREDVAITDPGAYAISGLLHVIGFALLFTMVLGLLRADAAQVGTTLLGRVTRWVAYGVAAALAFAMIGALIGGAAPGAEIAAVPAGIGFIGLFVLSLPLGIGLWRSPVASRLTAGILVAILPLLLIVGFGGELTGLELPIFVVESPLMLGLASLGYDLSTWSPRPTPLRRP